MQSQDFQDFDAFAESVRNVDCEMLLQNPTHRFWSINNIKLPSIHFQLGRLGSGNIVEGQSVANGYLLYMPITNTCTYSANGTVLAKNSFAILEPGCDFCVSTKVEHDWCTIFIPAHLLDNCDERVEPLSVSKKTICRVTPANWQLTHKFQSIISQIMIAAECSQFESSLAAIRAEEELLKVACLLVGQRPKDELHRGGRPKVQREEIIRHTRALLEERKGEQVRVGELAAVAEVSKRTLQTAFNEYYGVGPARYLQLRQFHQVHCALKAANLETGSVTDILLRHGQWEFGRFATGYRQLYGQLPSDTLRTKKR